MFEAEDIDDNDRAFGVQTLEPSTEHSPYDSWLQSTIFDFLDIADLATSNERHKALVALKIDFVARFKLIEAYLLVETAYAEAGKMDTVLEFVAACRAKVIILKKQLGI